MKITSSILNYIKTSYIKHENHYIHKSVYGYTIRDIYVVSARIKSSGVSIGKARCVFVKISDAMKAKPMHP